MKAYAELTYDEQKEVRSLFANWLRPYTKEVILKVIRNADDILANDVSMNMIRQLYERQAREDMDFDRSIGTLLDDFETFSKYDPRGHRVIEHSQSYRDILYDIYIDPYC